MKQKNLEKAQKCEKQKKEVEKEKEKKNKLKKSITRSLNIVGI